MTTSFCKSCGSCGFPMREPEDFAGADPRADYCGTCGEACGKLKPFEEAVLANAQCFVREQGIDPMAAREMARALLRSMPAWREFNG